MQHPNSRERLLRTLSAATFVIFFQAYMVAPLVPTLARAFGVSEQRAGLVIPAYLIPYGMATLIYGVIADRWGVRSVIFGSLASFVALTALTATGGSIGALIAWRLATGVGASGVVPLALVVIGASYPYEQRGRPLGWLFGAMAGGMAFGSTVAALLEPVIGWRGVFVAVSVGGATMMAALWRQRDALTIVPSSTALSIRDLGRGYADLLRSPRGRRTYTYVLLNSMFHSGVFSWLGVYFERRYGLGSVGIGLALLGYGVPGFLFGPLIGRLVDRWGRARLLPIGLGIGGLAAVLLIPQTTLLLAALSVTILSLGYDMTQPLLAGIVTSLAPTRPGQAMGLNVFTLFVAFGLGSLVFGALLPYGLNTALTAFATVQAVGTIGSVILFRSEVPVRRAS